MKPRPDWLRERRRAWQTRVRADKTRFWQRVGSGRARNPDCAQASHIVTTKPTNSTIRARFRPVRWRDRMRLDKGSGTIAADRDETSVMLLARMDDGPFALFHDLEQPFVKAFDHSGPTAFERRVRLRFGALAKAPKPEALPGDSPEYPIGRAHV